MRAHDVGPPLSGTLHVYPTALKAESVLRERARAEGCLLGPRVTTFPQLTEALARDLDVSARVLEPELAAVVLRRALERPDLPEALAAPRRGLLRELLAVIDELKAAYLAPPDVAELAAGLRPHPAAGRLGEVARVYAAYEAELARLGAVDRHGREWRVCEALAAAEAAGRRPRTLAGVERIVFAELYDFSVLQFLIATALIRLVGDAELVAFAHPENIDATRFLERTWNRFVGDPAIADQALPSFVVRGGRQGSLAAALRGVFARDRPPPVPGDGSIRLVVAPSRYREVEAAARDVRRRLEQGMPPERMAFLTRDLSRYGDLIEDVCRRFRIPVYFRKGKPLVANGLVRTCLDVMRCAAEGFPRRRLEALLDSDYLGAADPRLGRTLRAAGFVSEAARPLGECLAHAAALAVDDPVRGAARHARLVAGGPRLVALRDLVAGLDARRSVGGHVDALRRTLRRLALRPFGRDEVTAGVRRDARARARLDETLTALAALGRAMAMGPMPLGDFLGLLLAALEPQQIEDPAERTGSVRALSVLDARGLDFDTVYLLGLDDGTFPAPRSENPLLPDAVRRAMNPLAARTVRRKLGARADGLPLGGLLRTAREASLEDPFQFFLALSMAERELVLSYPAADERGNPTVASPFVDEVAACLVGGLEDVRTVENPTAVVPEAAACCEPGELVARAALARWSGTPEARADRLTPALRAAMPGAEARFLDIDRRAAIEERRSRYFLLPAGDAARRAALADAWVGRLGGETGLLAERLAAVRWTPTRLEALGRCAFRFFAGSVLGLAEERDADLEVRPPEQGTLFHRTLEGFLRDHPVLPRELDAARRLARAYLAETRAQAERTIPAKDPAFFALTWRRLEAALDELVVLEHEAEARRADAGLAVERWLERPFTLVLPAAGDEPALTVAGTPDRVEVERRGARAVTVRVLDYKVTRDRTRFPRLLDPAKELGRTGFQIPVYLLGALDAGIDGVDDETHFEGGYLVLLAADKEVMAPMSPALLGRGPRGPEDPPAIADTIRALVAGARAGHFDVDPHPCDPYCAYRAVCRYQPPPLEDEVGDA